MKKGSFRLNTLAISLLVIPSCSVFAATATTSFSVTATVLAACSVNATNLAFGNYNPAQVAVTNGQNTVTVTCTSGTTYNVGLDLGVGSGATLAARRMTSGANTLNYNLYSNASRTTVWGNTIGTNTVAGTGNGVAQPLTVYGSIPAEQYVPAGNYLDTINVTVTY